MIDEDAERRRQVTAAAMGEALAKVNDVVAQLRADLARARAEAENYRVQLLGEREARIDREAEISRLRAAACLRTPEDISDALTTAHGQGQEDAIETVAGWLGCAPKIGAVEAAIAARDVPYRPGLPSVKRVRAHEARGGRWQIIDPKGKHPSEAWAETLSALGETVVLRAARDVALEMAAWATRSSYRPCLPDGTPCPWND